MNWLEAFVFSQKILGMNARNLSYIKPYNYRKWVKLVDNKIKFKKSLQQNNIPTPKLIASIRSYEKLNNFDFNKLPKSFVLKPTSGFGGEGIVVIFGEHKKRTTDGERQWVKTKGVKISETMIHSHISNILDGTYSRTNSPDIAFFEERIKINKSFKHLAYKGIPDIRIIVFNRIPVMAMMRIPTKESDGKANLHLGGIGVGIDMATGVTTNAIMRERFIDTIPGTKINLAGIRIPYWNTILDIAIRTADVTNLGFTGVDIAIDRDAGPVVLEANARPGLAIQIANLAPLKERLQKVKGLKVKTVKRAIRLAKDLFGGEIEEEIEEITGRQVIGLIEEITLFGKDNQKQTILAKVDTGADSSSIDEALLIELGYGEVLKEFKALDIPEEIEYNTLNKLTDKINLKLKENPELHLLRKVAIVKAGNGYTVRPFIRIPVKIGDENTHTICSIVKRSHLKYQFLLGKNDLKKFIIDPRKELL
jgi:alpha-L-glutamate ligase-like protein